MKRALTKREKVHFDDMKKELDRLSQGHDKLVALQKECVELKKKLDDDLEQVLIHYLGFKKDETMPLTEILKRAAGLI